MNSQCTMIREAVHTLRNRLIEEGFAARAQAERTADIASHFHFSRNEAGCLSTADGLTAQLAMDLTEKVSGRVRTVIVAVQDGHWVWFVENMAKCPVEAADLIACVRQRIGARLTGQLTGKVVLQ